MQPWVVSVELVLCSPGCESVYLYAGQEGQTSDWGHMEALTGNISRLCPLTCLLLSCPLSLFISSRSVEVDELRVGHWDLLS